MTVDDLFNKTGAEIYNDVSYAVRQKRYNRDGWDIHFNESKKTVQITTPENILYNFKYEGFDDVLRELERFDITFAFLKDYRLQTKNMFKYGGAKIQEEVRKTLKPMLIANNRFLLSLSYSDVDEHDDLTFASAFVKVEGF
jgi:hypothetical protein